MAKKLSPTEWLTYTTIQIETEYPDGSAGSGTGFLFKFFQNIEQNTFVPFIITNKHVVEGAIKGRLIFTKRDNNNDPIDQDHFPVEIISDFAASWRYHPNSDVDLCSMPISLIISEAEKAGHNLFFAYLEKSFIPNSEQLNDLYALEEIIMVGYPIGIWDSYNNKPILRKGITATHPKFNYEGRKEFMIDAACFPGSSGSPVVIYNDSGYLNREGVLLVGQQRFLFLGVLYAGPQYSANGEIKVVNVPTKQKYISVSDIPVNLGYVIKAERVIELEELYKDVTIL